MKRLIFTWDDRTIATKKNFVDFFAVNEFGRLTDFVSVSYVLYDAKGVSVVSGSLTKEDTGYYSSSVVIPEMEDDEIGVCKIVWSFVRELGGDTETCEQQVEILKDPVSSFYRYAFIDDVRKEGYNLTKVVGSETVYVYSDEQIARALQFAESIIDKATGWYFGVDYKKESFRGEGSNLKHLRIPLIAFRDLLFYEDATTITDLVDELYTELYASLDKLEMNTFVEDPKNSYNPGLWYYKAFENRHYYTIQGLFGFTEPDFIGECPWGKIPDAIRRITVKLAALYLDKFIDGMPGGLYDGIITKEKTMDQEITKKPMMDYFLKLNAGRYVTGDPEIDAYLYMYRSPFHVKGA